MLDIRELMNLKEAYAEVYTPQELTEEQVWEEVETWVNSLIEEGYDLSDYTWEEMYESYLEEQGGSGASPRASAGVSQNPIAKAIRGEGQARNQPKPGSNIRGGGQFRPKMGSLPPSARQVTQYPQGVSTGVGGGNSGASRSATPAKPTPTATRPAVGAPAAPRPSAGAPAASARPSAGASAAPRPATTTSAAPRPAATTPAAKPAPAATAPAAKPSAMDQFAKANPKLAAASAERDRTRGTSATTNPLMKDMKSRLPAPKTPSPTTAKTGFDLAKKGVNLAASFDMFDVVKGYLIGEGYADTEEAALAIMANMSEEWRESIVEERAPGVRPYKAGPTQAEVRADAKRAAKKKVEKDKDKEGYGPEEKFKDWKLTSTPSTVNKKGETISQRMDKEAPYKTRPFSPLFTKQGSRTASAVTRATEGPGEPQSVTMPRKKSKPSREIVRRNKDTNESYNIILSYLLDEGYANSVEASESIMVSMSEDWVLSIIG